LTNKTTGFTSSTCIRISRLNHRARVNYACVSRCKKEEKVLSSNLRDFPRTRDAYNRQTARIHGIDLNLICLFDRTVFNQIIGDRWSNQLFLHVWRRIWTIDCANTFSVYSRVIQQNRENIFSTFTSIRGKELLERLIFVFIFILGICTRNTITQPHNRKLIFYHR